MREKRATDEAVVQLATRLPASLLQRVKVWCVENEVTVQDFVAKALREKVSRATKPKE
jgi:hypothetical protein